VLCLDTDEEVVREMERVNADPAGIRRMLPKARHYLIALEGVPAPLAHILKEAFLAHGGDAVVDRDLITGRVAHTRVMLCGTRNQFQRVIIALVEQGSRCETLAKEIEAAIRHFDSPALVRSRSTQPTHG
jgi:dihydropteroate synthase